MAKLNTNFTIEQFRIRNNNISKKFRSNKINKKIVSIKYFIRTARTTEKIVELNKQLELLKIERASSKSE